MPVKFLSAFMQRVEKWVNDPFKTVVFFAVFLMLFYTIQCSLLQTILGLDVLEAVSWGAQGTLGNAKHPPLSGWAAYGFTFLGNHKDWIMYLAAQLCLAIGVVYIFRTAKLFVSEYAAGTAALLCYFIFYYNPSETRFCTYPMEMMLIPLASYNFFRALQANKLLNWVALAIFCAAGLLNKYSFALVMLAFAVIFFRQRTNWRLLKSFKPYCAAIIMLLLIAPHLKWLYENDFVCLTHVSNRLNDTYKWYTPLVTLATALYPYGMMALVLVLALLPDFRSRKRVPILRQTGYDAGLIAVIPAITLVILSFTGDIIMMWFCSMATLIGLMLVCFFPWEIDRKFFSRVVVLLGIFSLGMMIGTTLDLLLNSSVRTHSDPQSYTIAAQNFYRKNDPLYKIPLVAGTRFEATLLENYLPHHPPACEVGDPVAMKRYREKIRREGALLIVHASRRDGTPEEIFKDFLREVGYDGEIIFEKHTYFYQAKWGKKRKRTYHLGYLPPQVESNRKPDNVIQVNSLPGSN